LNPQLWLGVLFSHGHGQTGIFGIWGYRHSVRHSDFEMLMIDEFGSEYAAVLLRDLALTELDDRTGSQALADGIDPREIWLAICRAQNVPEERWLGLNKKPKDKHAE
jgi:hypothetical protein